MDREAIRKAANGDKNVERWLETEVQHFVETWKHPLIGADYSAAQRYLMLFGRDLVLVRDSGNITPYTYDWTGRLIDATDTVKAGLAESDDWFVRQVMPQIFYEKEAPNRTREFKAAVVRNQSSRGRASVMESFFEAAVLERQGFEGSPRAITPLQIIDKSKLDERPHYVGVKNGVLDLRHGHLLDEKIVRELGVYCTRYYPVTYQDDPDERSMTPMVSLMFNGNPNSEHSRMLLSYLGRALYGEPPEAFLYLVGGPNSGKSTLITALRATLGSEWGVGKLASDALDANRWKTTHNDELAPFADHAIVCMEEAEDAGWATSGTVAKLKEMTSGPNSHYYLSRKGEQGTEERLRGFLLCVGNDLPYMGLWDPAVAKRARILRMPTHEAVNPNLRHSFTPDGGECRNLFSLMVDHAIQHPPGDRETDDYRHMHPVLKAEIAAVRDAEKPDVVAWAEGVLVCDPDIRGARGVRTEDVYRAWAEHNGHPVGAPLPHSAGGVSRHKFPVLLRHHIEGLPQPMMVAQPFPKAGIPDKYFKGFRGWRMIEDVPWVVQQADAVVARAVEFGKQ